MSREKNRQRLIAKLGVAHPGSVAFSILSEQKHREKIATIFTTRPPLANHSENRLIETIARGVESPDCRYRHMIQILGERQHRVIERLERRRHRIADFSRLRINVGIEQCLCYNAEREPHHLDVHVECFAIAPPRSRSLGKINHCRRVRIDALAMKRRLREPTLPQMKFIFACEKSVAE